MQHWWIQRIERENLCICILVHAREGSCGDCAPGSTYASLLSRWATHWRTLSIIVALQQRQGIAAVCRWCRVSAPPRVGRSIMLRRRREPGPDLFLIEGEGRGGGARTWENARPALVINALQIRRPEESCSAGVCARRSKQRSRMSQRISQRG